MPDPSKYTFGKPPIFLLKTKSTPHDGYEEYFRDRYEPVFVPVLEHRFHDENLKLLREYFLSEQAFLSSPSSSSPSSSTPGSSTGRRRRRRYGGIIFTSQRAVEAFTHVVTEEVGVDAARASSKNLILYTVGPATTRALRSIRETHLPDAEIHGEEAGNGERLAQMILAHYNPGHGREEEGQKPGLLFLVGEQRRDIIPKTLMSESRPPAERIPVEELVVYETGEMGSFERHFRDAVRAGEGSLVDSSAAAAAAAAAAVAKGVGGDQTTEQEQDNGGEVMWAVVFSPTGCDAMLRVLNITADSQHGPRRCLIATIGPTTRDYLREKYGFNPEVCAEKPSPEGVGEGIEKFMRIRG